MKEGSQPERGLSMIRSMIERISKLFATMRLRHTIYILPIVGLCLILVVAYLMDHYIVDEFIQTKTTQHDVLKNLLRFSDNTILNGLTISSRILWSTFAGMELIAFLGAFIVSGITMTVILRHIHKKGKVIIGFCIFLIPFASLLPINVIKDISSIPGVLIQYSLGMEIENLENIYSTMSRMTIGIAVMFAVLAAIILVTLNESPEKIMKSIQERIMIQRLLLYVGAAVLLTTLLQLNELFRWINLFAYPPVDKNKQTVLLDITNNLLTVKGIYYSLTLLAIYLPGELYLESRAKNFLVGIHGGSGQNIDSQMKEFGFSSTVRGHLPRFVAVLSPLIVGPFMEVLKKLM